MSSRSLARRAFGLLLTGLGFYLLGLALVGVLLWVPWAEATYQRQVKASGLLCLIGAAWVAFGFLPRFERRAPLPSSRGASAQSHLHAFVRDIAGRVGHPMPHRVELSLDVNAYAARRGNWFREHTIVGVGLPMFAYLDRDELASVLAHEFGHHLAGDVRLGPWVHRARRSIHRALDHLDGSSFFFHLPFLAYGELFLRLSLEVSRAQELFADGLGARVAGTPAAARALAVVHEKGPLWSVYWDTEVAPVLAAGYLPPLLAGFQLFEAGFSQDSPENIAKLRDANRGPSTRFDSHPSLSERLEALGAVPSQRAPGSCLELLEGVPQLEAELVELYCVLPDAKLIPIEWHEVAAKVWLPRYRADVRAYAHVFDELTPSRLLRVTERLADFRERLRGGLAVLSPEAERKRALALFGAWLLVALVKRGFELQTSPGRALRAVRGDVSVEPFELIACLFRREIDEASWKQRCAELGLP